MKETLKLMLLTVAMMLFGLHARAGSINEKQAKAKALSFLQNRQSSQGSTLLARARTPKELTNTPAGETAIYVFNIDKQGGFVIVSGDDRAREILGYSDNGSFDVNNIPEALRVMLTFYSRQISMLGKKENITDSVENILKARAQTSSAMADVSPLLTTTWNQGYPYNAYCPKLNDQTALTGCVATAIAQIAYYHKFPKDKVPSLSAYTSATNKINVTAWGATTFDWDNMIDSYSGSYTETQKEAVATLMRYCGQAAQMDYGFTSAAYNGDALLAFTEKLGYNPYTAIRFATDYSAEAWEDLIYTELSEKRPVFYAARNGSGGNAGGHAFIIDGYKTDGNYFHVNWGWGGECDGYFNLFALDSDAAEAAPSVKGWHYSMQALIGLSPKTMNRPNLTKDETGAYLINNTDDWDELSENLDIYNGGTFKLTDDIRISTVVGSEDLAFSGTFDGQGHVITVDIDEAVQGTSPFCRIESGSTIKGLKITGTVTSTAYHASGLVGIVNKNTDTPLQILGCEVAVTINGNSYCGGFVGHAGESQVVFSDCLFSGTLKGCSKTGWFLGWKERACHPVFYNCFVTSDYTTEFSNIGNGGSSSDATFNNCYSLYSYYRNPQAIVPSSNKLQDGTIARALQQGTRSWTTGQVWGQKLGIDEHPVLTNDANDGVYEVTFIFNGQTVKTFTSNSPIGDKMPTGENLGLKNATFTYNGAAFDGTTTFSSDPTIIVSGTTAYTMTIGATENGSINVNDNTTLSGTLKKVTVVPADGYVVSAVKVTDANNNLLPVTKVSNTDNEYVFSFPKSSVTVTAEFVPGQTAAVRFINNGMTLPASSIEADQCWTADTWTIWGGKFNGVYDVRVGTPPADDVKQQWYEEGYALTNSAEDMQPDGKPVTWENHAASFKSGGNYDYFKKCGASYGRLGDFYIRRIFTFNTDNVPSKLYLSYAHKDAPVEYYINGKLVYSDNRTKWEGSVEWNKPGSVALSPEDIALIHTDGTPNVMAVHVSHNYSSTTYHLDCGLYDPSVVNYEVTGKNTVRARRNAFFAGDIVIPETVIHNGMTYTVTELAPYVFGNCTALKSVELPPTITQVPEDAFNDSYSIDYVKSYVPIYRENQIMAAPVDAVEFEVPMNIVQIYRNAFKFTEKLTKLTLPRKLSSIGDKAFVGCKALRELYINSKAVPSTASNAFEGIDKSAITVYVYESLLEAFKNSWGEEFTYVTMPDPQPLTLNINVETPGTLAERITVASEEKGGIYDDVVDLTVTGSINEDDLGFIDDEIDKNLKKLDLGDVVVENNRFLTHGLRGCGCETLILPKTLISMHSYGTLYDCENLKTIEIPNSVTTIEGNLLYNCKSLETVTGGDGITKLSDYLLVGDACPNLKSPVILNNYFCRLPINTEGAYEVPGHVTVLGYFCMKNVKGLTSLTLPESITTIRRFVVYQNENLKDIYFHAVDLPVTDSYAFSDFNQTSCTLHVYEEMVDVFKKSSVWKDFNIVGDLGAMPVQIPMNESDYADLCAIYNKLGGSKWKSKWIIEKNIQASARWSGVTFDEEGYVTDINLSDKGLSGDISSLTITGLTRLKSLNLSKNKITGDIMPLKKVLPSTCDLNVLEQDLGFIGEHTLYELLDYEGLPSIAYYNNGSLASSLCGVQGHCQFYHKGTDGNPQWDCNIYRYTTTVSDTPFYWTSPATVECLYPHRFTFTYNYEMGDANMDDNVDVLDLQSTLNSSNGQAGGLFNICAADTYGPDDDINVQDIVTTVNILLAQEESQQASARAFGNVTPSETEACVSIEGGNVVLYTNKPVAALDLRISGISPQQLVWNTESMGFATVTSPQGNGTHAIIYSLQPRQMEPGKTILATFNGNVTPRVASAVLSDSSARRISVGNTVPTGIITLNGNAASAWSITNVSGTTVLTGSNATEAEILRKAKSCRLNGVFIINMDGVKHKVVIKGGNL